MFSFKLCQIYERVSRYQQIIVNPIENLDMVVAGGFEEAEMAASTNPLIDLAQFETKHEGADTRVILHVVNSPFKQIIIMASDKDICILLKHHFQKMNADECWMMTGNHKSRKFIPIHEICEKLSDLQKKHFVSPCFDRKSYDFLPLRDRKD